MSIARHTDGMSELILAHADRAQEFLLQNFAWMRITQPLQHLAGMAVTRLGVAIALVIVDDFDIGGPFPWSR